MHTQHTPATHHTFELFKITILQKVHFPKRSRRIFQICDFNLSMSTVSKPRCARCRPSSPSPQKTSRTRLLGRIRLRFQAGAGRSGLFPARFTSGWAACAGGPATFQPLIKGSGVRPHCFIVLHECIYCGSSVNNLRFPFLNAGEP